ncbi:hypothetical protein TURU_049391 [Turdus rufiventris]|nr:hypothetical protein TURU_049391 [Turdus rufiventris]
MGRHVKTGQLAAIKVMDVTEVMKGSQREEFGDVSPMQLKSIVIPTNGAHVFLLQNFNFEKNDGKDEKRGGGLKPISLIFE